jgi:hypothetical protein
VVDEETVAEDSAISEAGRPHRSCNNCPRSCCLSGRGRRVSYPNSCVPCRQRWQCRSALHLSHGVWRARPGYGCQSRSHR